jgi:multisubunit Na+/H+ antiporter MnhB subunit
MKDMYLWLLVAVCVAGTAFGAVHHWRFIKAGGHRGFKISARKNLSEAARGDWNGMLTGYGIFIGSIAIMLFISAIWGPGGAQPGR